MATPLERGFDQAVALVAVDTEDVRE
jgi:hypothetical protein